MIDGSGPEKEHHKFSRELYLFAAAFPHISSCANSFIYATTNATFREGYIVFFFEKVLVFHKNNNEKH